MAWSQKDAGAAFDWVRDKADEVFNQLLLCARPVLQHGMPEEALCGKQNDGRN
jgi:hypothetical protein